MERAIHTNLIPKSPPTFTPHLTHDQPNIYELHQAIRPSGLRSLDQDSTSELSTFGAHKYFNQGTNNDNYIQKVTINSNSSVFPLLNMDTEHKHNTEQGDIIKSTRSFSYSASSSLGGNGNGNHSNMINNYKAHSFHVPTPIPPPSNSSSKSTLNNKAGLLFHHPQTSKILVNPSQTSFTKKIKTSLSKSIWLLRRKCPCNHKKSVQVKGNKNTNTNNTKTRKSKKSPPPQAQNVSHNKIHKDSLNHKAPPPLTTTTTASSNKEMKSQRLFQFQPTLNQVKRPSSEAFTFPLFLATNSTNPTKPHQVLLNVVYEEEDTTPRESLHVFQPPSPPTHVPWMMMLLVMQVLIFLRLKASPLKLLHFHTPLLHTPLHSAMKQLIMSCSSPLTPEATCGGGCSQGILRCCHHFRRSNNSTYFSHVYFLDVSFFQDNSVCYMINSKCECFLSESFL